jgi:hypothetical protein
MLRILILGGYGTFGGRLAQLLADDKRLEILIAGRSRQKAQSFCDHLAQGATKRALAFDRDSDLEWQLGDIKPDILVDATGPFQLYGDDPYRVIKACLKLGIHYLDLADGSDFVKGISQFEAEARARNIYVLSGVSSFPVLTAAVVRRLSKNMQRVTAITGGIAPSPYAGVGLNVIRAIAEYSGKPVKLIRNGRPGQGYALTESLRYTIAPPGRLPLHNIRFSLVDVPDLQTLPELWTELDSIWMGAGPVPGILHHMLSSFAWLVRLRLLPSLSPFAAIFYRVINIVRWGEHRGGMFVSVEGIDNDGNNIERSWHLLAEGDDGPLIPSMAVAAIVQRMLVEHRPASGARPATGDLELEDYEALFSQRTIYTGQREATTRNHPLPLYQRVLGDAWMSLPKPIMAMHQPAGNSWKAEGVATVERGASLPSRLVATLIGFPKTGNNIPVQVVFELTPSGEIWRRTFDGQSFKSLQWEGAGRADKLLCEKFGALTFCLALVFEYGKLNLVVRRWSFLGIPLPLALAPTGQSYEFVENGKFHFHVEITHPLIGLVVRYQGWLEPS